MSWFAHHPEEYDEICRTGIQAKLEGLLSPDRSANGSDYVSHIEEIVEVLYTYGPLQRALLEWAHTHIVAAESNYWARRADAAHDLYKDKLYMKKGEAL